jgi:periplasmic divalent cation tolerance protein
MNIVILVTCANKKEAESIGSALVKERLIACVNIIGGARSLFWWEGKVDSAGEELLIMKSQKSKLAAVIKRVKSLHSYKVPEVIALPIIGGNKDYLRWLDESVR